MYVKIASNVSEVNHASECVRGLGVGLRRSRGVGQTSQRSPQRGVESESQAFGRGGHTVSDCGLYRVAGQDEPRIPRVDPWGEVKCKEYPAAPAIPLRSPKKKDATQGNRTCPVHFFGGGYAFVDYFSRKPWFRI